MTIEDYLLNHGTEDRKIYNIVKMGRIDKLLEICPDAETLVAKVKNCKKFGFDIMANIALNNNIEMFDKIIAAYFNEKSEENNRLRREFLLSHQVGTSPKDYHWFRQYASVEAQRTISRLTGEPIAFCTPDLQRMVLYNRLSRAWNEAPFLSDPHKKMDNTRLGIAPKGTAATEFRGYIGGADGKNGLVYNRYTETYPRIRLAYIPKDQPEGTLRCPVMELTDIPFTPGHNDLAEQAFRRMHFPDLWIDDGYFDYLRKLGATYCDIKENDPVAAASFKNFNENGKFFVLENKRDISHKGNSNEGIDYIGYSSADYICLRTDKPYGEDTVMHELAHDTDRPGDFKNSDLYKFVSTAMAAHPEKSDSRKMAVNETRNFYPASEYETESLARIAQSYLPARHRDDPLLAATYDIFSIYGQAQLDRDSAIINRIKNCMRLRIPGNVGYQNFEQAVKAKELYFINQDHHRGISDGILYSSINTPPPCSETELLRSEQEFGKAYGKLSAGKNISVEDILIKCIKDEMLAVEKIKSHPEAGKVILNTDILSRDNITDPVPLEVMAAHNFTSTVKTSSAMSKMRTPDKLEQQLRIQTDHCRDTLELLALDSKEGQPLDRSLFCDGIRSTTRALIFANALACRYFPHYEQPKLDINDCLPQADTFNNTGTSQTLQRIQNLQENIELINNPDPDLGCSAEIIDNPYSPVKGYITSGEKSYQKLQKHLQNFENSDERNEEIGYFLETIENQSPSIKSQQITNLRIMQLLYKDLHPEARTLPPDLRLSSLTPASLKKMAQDKPSQVTQTIRKYAQICRSRLEKAAEIPSYDTHQR